VTFVRIYRKVEKHPQDRNRAWRRHRHGAAGEGRVCPRIERPAQVGGPHLESRRYGWQKRTRDVRDVFLTAGLAAANFARCWTGTHFGRLCRRHAGGRYLSRLAGHGAPPPSTGCTPSPMGVIAAPSLHLNDDGEDVDSPADWKTGLYDWAPEPGRAGRVAITCLWEPSPSSREISRRCGDG
jgi:hypothetical protein